MSKSMYSPASIRSLTLFGRGGRWTVREVAGVRTVAESVPGAGGRAGSWGAGAGPDEGREILSCVAAVAGPVAGGWMERRSRSSMPRCTSRCTDRWRSGSESSHGVRVRAEELRDIGERSRELEREVESVGECWRRR